MGAYEGLSRYFADGILQKANELGYGEFFTLILKGDEDTLEQKYNSVWNTLKTCKYNMDYRHPIEFGRDMVATWVFQDCVIGTLKSSGLNISFGKDYLTRKMFSPRLEHLDNNVIIDTINNKYSLEIRCDYTGAWTRTGKMYLGTSKYKKMKKDNAIMLCFSTIDNKLLIMNSSCINNATYIKSYDKYGGKPVYEVSIPETAICNFTIPTMIKEIKNYCLYN